MLPARLALRSSGRRIALPSRALFHQCAVRRSDKPQPDHPSKLASRPFSEDKPVADLTKEDESKITGVADEPEDGPPPRTFFPCAHLRTSR